MSPAEFNFELLQTVLLAGIWIGVVILVMQPRGEKKAIEGAREIAFSEDAYDMISRMKDSDPGATPEERGLIDEALGPGVVL